MTRPSISIALNSAGMWVAEGSLLGHTVMTSAPSLWECLEQCQQQVWDIEISHDVTEGGLDLEELISAHGSGQPTAGGDRKDGPLDSAEDVPVDLLRVVRHLVLRHQPVSVALVQRHLGLDYSIACRAVAALEAEGSVTPPDHEGQRRVLKPSGHLKADSNNLTDDSGSPTC
jgi:DNA segregation ATPase FtsK/SpoIIIE-like protein